MTIRVLLVEDQRVFREALKAFLDTSETDIEVVGEAGDGRDALAQVNALRPDVVVLDVAMPGMNGFTTAARLRARHRETKVLALSAHAEKHYVLGMFDAGAAGYISKNAAARERVQAVRAVASGESYVSPELINVTTAGMRERRQGLSELDVLGRREREVLQLLAEGERSLAIAERLSISVGTVEAHRRNMMRKLHLHSVAELTKYAIRTGLTEV